MMVVLSERSIGSIGVLVLGIEHNCGRVVFLVGVWNTSGVDGSIVCCFRKWWPIGIGKGIHRCHLCMPISPKGGRWMSHLHGWDDGLKALVLFVESFDFVREVVIVGVELCEGMMEVLLKHQHSLGHNVAKFIHKVLLHLLMQHCGIGDGAGWVGGSSSHGRGAGSVVVVMGSGSSVWFLLLFVGLRVGNCLLLKLYLGCLVTGLWGNFKNLLVSLPLGVLWGCCWWVWQHSCW